MAVTSFDNIKPYLQATLDDYGVYLQDPVRAALETVLADPGTFQAQAHLLSPILTRPFSRHVFGDQLAQARQLILGTQAMAATGTTGSTSRPDMGYLDDGAYRELDELSALMNETADMKPMDGGSWHMPIVTSGLLRRFMDAYDRITGGMIEWAPTVWNFLESYSHLIDRIMDRPFRIGISGFSAKDFDKPDVHRFFVTFWKELLHLGIPAEDIRVVSGFTRVGVPAIAYETSAKTLGTVLESVGKELGQSGITSGASIFELVHPVDSVAMIGKEWDGAEQELYYSSTFHYLALGGGGLSADEIQDRLKQDPESVTLIKGFWEKKRGKMIPGASDKYPDNESFVIPNAHLDPEEAAKAAAKRVVHHYFKVKEKERTPTLADLALRLRGDKLQPISPEAFNQENFKRARILRLLKAIGKIMRSNEVPESDIKATISRLVAAFIIELPAALENPRDWAMAARRVIERVAPDVAQLSIDEPLFFASQIGSKTMESHVNLFDQTTTEIPRKVVEFDTLAPHSMKIEEYLTNRYGVLLMHSLRYYGTPKPTQKMSALDMFMGNRTELEAYYRRMGYTKFTHHNSNTAINFITIKGDNLPRRMVIEGVASHSKYAHTLLQLKFLGIDVTKINIRGSLDSYVNRSAEQLELVLNQLPFPPTALILGSRWWPMELIAQMSGHSRKGNLYAYDQLKPVSISVGPWNFDYVVVEDSEGHRSTLVAMRMPNGDLAEAAVNKLVNAGTRIVMTTGAGGSLTKDDHTGNLHVLSETHHDDALLRLSDMPNLETHSFNGFAEAERSNITVDSPLEENEDWIHDNFGKLHNVDVETYYIFKALRAAAARGIPLYVAPYLFISDVVGEHPLEEKISFDDVYGAHLETSLRNFLSELGIQSVHRNGDILPLDMTQPEDPLLKRHRQLEAELNLWRSIHEAPMVAGKFSVNDWSGTADQLKGEKRVVFVGTESFDSDERAWFTDLLSRSSSHHFWIVTAASDRNHGAVIKMAREHGFETVVLMDRPGPLQMIPDYMLPVQNTQAAQEMLRDLTTSDAENNAKHFRILLGSGETSAHIFGRYSVEDDLIISGERKNRASRVAMKMTKDVTEGWMRLEETLEALPSHPDQIDWSAVPTWLNHRHLLMFSGASKGAWPNIAGDNPATKKGQRMVPPTEAFFARAWQVRALINYLLRHIHSDRVVLGTGATDYGFEHEVHRMAPDMGFTLLGTPVEHSYNDKFGLLDATATAGIAWFGKARPLGKLLTKDQVIADVISVGGGGIMTTELDMHHQMGVDIHAMLGPHGAANEFAQSHPGNAFRSVDEIIDRLREKNPKIILDDPLPVEPINQLEEISYVLRDHWHVQEVIMPDGIGVTIAHEVNVKDGDRGRIVLYAHRLDPTSRMAISLESPLRILLNGQEIVLMPEVGLLPDEQSYNYYHFEGVLTAGVENDLQIENEAGDYVYTIKNGEDGSLATGRLRARRSASEGGQVQTRAVGRAEQLVTGPKVDIKPTKKQTDPDIQDSIVTHFSGQAVSMQSALMLRRNDVSDLTRDASMINGAQTLLEENVGPLYEGSLALDLQKQSLADERNSREELQKETKDTEIRKSPIVVGRATESRCNSLTFSDRDRERKDLPLRTKADLTRALRGLRLWKEAKRLQRARLTSGKKSKLIQAIKRKSRRQIRHLLQKPTSSATTSLRGGLHTFYGMHAIQAPMTMAAKAMVMI